MFSCAAVAHVRVARRAQVERNVELGAAHGHVGIAVGVDDAFDAARADLLGELEAAVHGAGGVRAEDVNIARWRVDRRARRLKPSGGCFFASRIGLGPVDTRDGHARRGQKRARLSQSWRSIDR